MFASVLFAPPWVAGIFACMLASRWRAWEIIAAGMLIVPMAWLYVRYKRGATIEVKV